MNATFTAIMNSKTPKFHGNIRHQSRKEWAIAVRRLLKELNIKGVSVTTLVYSMAQTIDITLPTIENANSIEHQKVHDDLWRAGKLGFDCPSCKERQDAKNRLEDIILTAFPDLDNRSDSRTDYFDYCLSFN